MICLNCIVDQFIFQPSTQYLVIQHNKLESRKQAFFQNIHTLNIWYLKGVFKFFKEGVTVIAFLSKDSYFECLNLERHV